MTGTDRFVSRTPTGSAGRSHRSARRAAVAVPGAGDGIRRRFEEPVIEEDDIATPAIDAHLHYDAGIAPTVHSGCPPASPVPFPMPSQPAPAPCERAARADAPTPATRPDPGSTGTMTANEGAMTPPGSACTAYGLEFRSEISVPFRPVSPGGRPDVTIRFGTVPESLPAAAAEGRPWQAVPGAYRLDVDGVARYFVTEGREIVIEPMVGDEAAVRTFLLGSVLAACLQQRGILTVHASAIETATGAVLFAGASGAGKSTLLAALVDRGYPMLADDVTGVVLDGDRPVALPAFPAVRLWADAVEALDWRARTAGRVRDELDKFVAPVECFRPAALPIRAVFTLRSHNRETIEIESTPPGTAVELLLRYTYRKRCVRALGRQAEQFRIVTALARQVPLSRVTRPVYPLLVSTLADRIEGSLRADAAIPPTGAITAPDHRPGGIVTARRWMAEACGTTPTCRAVHDWLTLLGYPPSPTLN